MADLLDDPDVVVSAIEAVAIRDYVARGRSLQHVGDAELHATWVAAATSLLTAPSRAAVEHEEDARAEMAIRGTVPDFDLVREEISAAATRLHDSMQPAELVAERVIDRLRAELRRRH